MAVDRQALSSQGYTYYCGWYQLYTEAGMQKKVGGSSGFKAEKESLQGRPPSKDLALLGLTSSATRAAILAAFRRKAHTYHPDKGGDAGEFRKLVAAKNAALGRAYR